MDYIVKELQKQIKRCEEDAMKINFYRTLIEYNLRLLTAILWQIRYDDVSETIRKKWIYSLTKGSDGNFVTVLKKEYNNIKGMDVEPSILDIFSKFLKERNEKQSHDTVDYYMIEDLKEWENYYDYLKEISISETDSSAQYQKAIFAEKNNLYYVRSISNGVASTDIFESNGADDNDNLPVNTISPIFRNESFEEKKLFIFLKNKFFKISPFIQYDCKNESFMMFNGFDNGNIKYSYITRNSREQCKFQYSYIPPEFENIIPNSVKNDQRFKTNRDLQISINRFEQFKQYEREFCETIPLDALDRLTEFLMGNNCFGAVRGQGGIGKTSIVFLWIQRIMKNNSGILDKIREKFPLKRILFYSAKQKLYTNVGFESTNSDVNNYENIISHLYSDLPLDHGSKLSKEKAVRSYFNKNVDREGVLIIIDDYESLDETSRNQLQNLKDIFDPSRAKLLITTRFLSSESKDILISRLDVTSCREMTDYIFGSTNWRKDDGILPETMYRLTEGIPLRIWYAKSLYLQKRLTYQTKELPTDENIENYLFSNFIYCFQSNNKTEENQFIQNFLQVLCRYTQSQGSCRLTEISQFSSIFLSLEDILKYDAEFPYFQYLTELKLLEERKESQSLDFSQLLSYISWQNAQKTYTETFSAEQQILLKLASYLDESQKQSCLAILEASNQLASKEKEFILDRLLKFNAVNEEDFTKVLKYMFQSKTDSDKLSFYQNYPKWFEKDSSLANSFLLYIKECSDVQLKKHGEIMKNFLQNAQETIKDDNSIKIAFRMELRLFVWLLDYTGKIKDTILKNTIFKSTFQEMDHTLNKYLKKIPENSELEKEKDNNRYYNDCCIIYI